MIRSRSGLCALEEAGRVNECAVVGQYAEPKAHFELRVSTHLIGSVAYFPEKYGEGVIGPALDILFTKVVPGAVSIRHQLLTPENIEHFQPNDSLLGTPRAAL